jgi:hypothetical protein
MTPQPPEGFRAPPTPEDMRRLLDRHHGRAGEELEQVDEWNSHWLKKVIDRPRALYMLGNGLGQGVFKRKMMMGSNMASLIGYS